MEPDGDMLATTSFFGGRITLSGTATGRPIRDMMRSATYGRSLAFTRDGEYVITRAADWGPPR